MIVVKSLKKVFAGGTWITYRDCTFETGKSYCLLGASGCGKSTLLNMIAGVITPSEGSVVIDDTELSALPQRRRDEYRVQNIGYIFQDFRLIEDMTVMDNLSVLSLEKVDISQADAVLRRLGIEKLKRKRITQLSGGEKQRVAIARALVKRPRLILADEPTGSLNYSIGRSVMEALKDAAQGNTLICVTHDDRLSDLFDEVLDMNEIAAGGEEEGGKNA